MRPISKVATVRLLAAAFGMCALVAGAAAVSAQAPAPAITRTQILDVPLEGLKGMDGIMYITDIPPGLSAPRHSHPGYEFNYILKGAVTFEPDGEKPFTLKAGQGTYNPLGHIHLVKNASATEPAQIVAVLVHQQGQPLATPAP